MSYGPIIQKHQYNVSKKEEHKEMQEQGTTDLARDLCKMAMSANIPWNVFDSPMRESYWFRESIFITLRQGHPRNPFRTRLGAGKNAIDAT